MNSKPVRILISVLLVMILALSMFACGNETKKTDADVDPSASQTSDNTSGEDITTSSTTEESTTEAEPENTGRKRDLTQFEGKKLIAITFDDGPSMYTAKLLDGLDKYNARVTFFVVGNRAAQYSTNLKRAYDMGNQIASHSYTHANLKKLSVDGIRSELDKTDEAIKAITGEAPDTLRPPYGSVNDTVKQTADKYIVTWTVDTLDWKNRNAQSVCNAILNDSFDGAIVLLHDLYETSVDGALAAMSTLQERGYAFVTVDEMAELRGASMNTTDIYSCFRPAAETTSEASSEVPSSTAAGE